MQNELLESYQANLTPHEHIEKWKNSGVTAKAYCLKTGLSNSTLYYWKKKYYGTGRLKNEKIRVTRIDLKTTSLNNDPIILSIGKNFKIKLSSGFNERDLKKIINVITAIEKENADVHR